MRSSKIDKELEAAIKTIQARGGQVAWPKNYKLHSFEIEADTLKCFLDFVEKSKQLKKECMTQAVKLWLESKGAWKE